jgi:hypothetical protein
LEFGGSGSDGSQRGAERVAIMYTLIQTAKLDDVDPQAWLADILARIADISQTRLSDLLPGIGARALLCGTTPNRDSHGGIR